MPSSYSDWCTAFDLAAAGRPYLQARRVILERETRVPTAQQAFKDLLTASFDAHMAVGLSPGPAALAGLDATLRGVAGHHEFQFLIRMDPPEYNAAITHVTGRYLSRFGTFGRVDTIRGAAPVLRASSADVFRTPKDMIWLTPDKDCPATPDEAAKALGLPHFQGHIAYRTQMALAGTPQYVPTCFDAGLFEAWQEPPSTHTGPCGLTRHLETGRRIHNEFVVRSTDVGAADLTLERLPAAGPPSRVGRLRPDYLVDR